MAASAAGAAWRSCRRGIVASPARLRRFCAFESPSSLYIPPHGRNEIRRRAALPGASGTPPLARTPRIPDPDGCLDRLLDRLWRHLPGHGCLAYLWLLRARRAGNLAGVPLELSCRARPRGSVGFAHRARHPQGGAIRPLRDAQFQPVLGAFRSRPPCRDRYHENGGGRQGAQRSDRRVPQPGRPRELRGRLQPGAEHRQGGVGPFRLREIIRAVVAERREACIDPRRKDVLHSCAWATRSRLVSCRPSVTVIGLLLRMEAPRHVTKSYTYSARRISSSGIGWLRLRRCPIFAVKETLP